MFFHCDTPRKTRTTAWMASALDQQEVALMWPLTLCGQPEKLQAPLLGQESMYCKQMPAT